MSKTKPTQLVKAGEIATDIQLSFLRAVRGDSANAVKVVPHDPNTIIRVVSTLKTPRKWIRKRKGKRDKSGKEQIFEYVEGGVVVRALNVVFGVYWGNAYKIIDYTDHDAIVECTIKVFDPSTNTWVARSDVGGKKMVYNKDNKPVIDRIDMLKGAYTDSEKRAARQWGLFTDLWIKAEQEVEKRTAEALADVKASDLVTNYARQVVLAFDKGGITADELQRVRDMLVFAQKNDQANATNYQAYIKIIDERLAKLSKKASK